MGRLRLLTAGESHGQRLTAVLDGCPAGVSLTASDIDAELARRQSGYGRGARQAIERDTVEITGGVRHGITTGGPLALSIANRDAANWGAVVSVEPVDAADAGEPIRVPRPGHADLGGALLYDLADIRDVIERASARETAARVACGAVARRLLAELGCQVRSHVVAIGGVVARAAAEAPGRDAVEADPVRCADPEASARMRAAIDAAAEAGDTLGGVFEVVVSGYPPGVGSYAQGDRRLQSRLAAAVFTIPAIKGVEFGLGFEAARLPGSQVHDAIAFDEERGYVRETDRSGGVEGGISTGEDIVVRAAMKPIASLRRPLTTVELGTHRALESRYERSDVCAVPAAAVVAEAVVALALADAALDRFGGASLAEMRAALRSFLEQTLRR